jgi:hypothetical protein
MITNAVLARGRDRYTGESRYNEKKGLKLELPGSISLKYNRNSH